MRERGFFQVSSGTRSNRVPTAFRPRSDRVRYAFGTRSERKRSVRLFLSSTVGANEYSNSTNSKIDVQCLINLIFKKIAFCTSHATYCSQVEI
jgi:hypothetical protein